MSVYTTGQSTAVAGLRQISVNEMREGVYVLYYKTPTLAYRIFSPETVAGIIKGWLNIKNKTVERDGGTSVEVLGVAINTDSGDVYVKVNARYIPPPTITIGGKQVPAQVTEAGVNPLAVLAIVAGLFAALDIGLTLMQVWTGTPADPCKLTGVTATAQCAANRGFWLLIGAAVGIAVITIIALKNA